MRSLDAMRQRAGQHQRRARRIGPAIERVQRVAQRAHPASQRQSQRGERLALRWQRHPHAQHVQQRVGQQRLRLLLTLLKRLFPGRQQTLPGCPFGGWPQSVQRAQLAALRRPAGCRGG
jgi:hypothetical protein